MVRSRHTWKFGGQYLAADNSSNSQTFFGGRFNLTAQLPFITLASGCCEAGINLLLNSERILKGSDA
jgi:hypothetical protein